jgi:hypothetical protein
MPNGIELRQFDAADEQGVPYADNMGWYKCDDCENLHLRLFDSTGELMCVATVSRDMLSSMKEVIDGPIMRIQ